eukprot:403291-Pelagomonas_calceolata.AAC.4
MEQCTRFSVGRQAAILAISCRALSNPTCSHGWVPSHPRVSSRYEIVFWTLLAPIIVTLYLCLASGQQPLLGVHKT